MVALALYCELAAQRGSITDLLDVILLLWNLWHTAKSDNRSRGLTSAPLIPLVQRLQVCLGSCCQMTPISCFIMKAHFAHEIFLDYSVACAY